MNKVQLIGRWVKDVELTLLQNSGVAVAKGTIAVDRRFKKEGQPTADFLPIVIWRKQAEATANYCGQKGNLIGITGRIETRNYQNAEGNRVYITEIVAEEVEFLNFQNKGNNQTSNIENNADMGEDITLEEGEDVPF